jgi:hypothetical protein
MQWLLTISTLALASQLALSQGPSDQAQVRSGESAADRAEASGSGAPVPPVLKTLEPPESRVVRLPGAVIGKPPKPAAKLGRSPAPLPAVAAPPSTHVPMPPPSAPPTPTPPEVPPAPPLDVPKPALKPFFPPELSSASIPPTPELAPAPAIDLAAPPLALPLPATAGLPPMPAPAEPPPAEPPPAEHPTGIPIAPSSANPDAAAADFQSESALFLQKQIGWWSLVDARTLLGNPERQRPALDDNQAPNGQIYAFQDPTRRYKELELDFDAENGNLRTVFVYPRNMTWQDCRRMFGANVSATPANKGRIFYSYLNRKLDVLVAPGGQVISLGLY